MKSYAATLNGEELKRGAGNAADAQNGSVGTRYLGIDAGAETLKVVELARQGGHLRWTRRQCIEHGKEPGPALLNLLRQWDWDSADGAAITGRLSSQVSLRQVPLKQAQARGSRFLHGHHPATVVSIGSHGYSVLELRASGMDVFRENNRCSQGTGNFLRQLVERFSLTVEAASDLCADVEKAAPLSGRCPVILKTDMTHLANKGENRAQILAGLFDAICENVMVLIKPGISPNQVILIGGVSQSRRVRNIFRQRLAAQGMTAVDTREDEARYFEALGSALVAADHPRPLPRLEQLLAPARENKLEQLPPLAQFLPYIKRLPRPLPPSLNRESRRLMLGLDIGSTGSKAVALDPHTLETVWEGYRQTSGMPVEAAQALLKQFVESPAGHGEVSGLGVTGSGREIVGSLLTTCYGKDAVYILNEIAAHAEGALHFDRQVDTIFEIGGQDAKYIRLAGGRVVDCAMNEACSAGTGSFIEEQGRKFSGIRDVIHLGEEALSAAGGVSLGQHCSVFMAEIIDEAVSVGVDQPSIIAGLYDSIIQNYLNRVKGSRSVGKVIFCQGMPFSSDALAAAVARQTGSRVVIPPNPGTVGALGIALLARKELDTAGAGAIDPQRFLQARIEQKDAFVCKSTTGCGGAGNKCRIDRLRTRVDSQMQWFTWGGGCSLYDKGTRKRKLPDLAPDPFREREELVQTLTASLAPQPGRLVIAITDEFMLKGLFAFFARFLYELGFNLEIHRQADPAALKRGIKEANIPYCAPMQLFHGLTSHMADSSADRIFVPMVRELPRQAEEKLSKTCPIVQAAPDLLRHDLQKITPARLLSPIINCGPENLESETFKASCWKLAAELNSRETVFAEAFAKAQAAQAEFDQRCLEIGRRALAFCRERDIPPVVVLGRPYTIYNTVLNSNVPAILREQGAIGIPVDCFDLERGVPIFPSMYWSYGQRIMRAAHQIRRMPGAYSLYCSNYSCGPDSFCLHFYGYIMEGKPYAIIETDGHSGDAGTKTRVEAFLHCVDQDRRAGANGHAPKDFRQVELESLTLESIQARGSKLLIPMLGPGTRCMTACFRGLGVDAESLPVADQEIVRLGRRYTSGKECLPMCTTLGSLLKRLQQDGAADQHYTFLMPRALGPCRFGIYNLLNQITLERLGWKNRVDIWSPAESGYFNNLPPKFSILVFAGWMANDLLLEALHDARPVEKKPGMADELYQRRLAELLQFLEKEAGQPTSLTKTLWEVARGSLFGITRMLENAAQDFARIKTPEDKPTVMLVGEIYVRCDSFANDEVIRKLEARGLRVRLAPFNEFMEYVDYYNRTHRNLNHLSQRLRAWIQLHIQNITYGAMAAALQWPRRSQVKDTVQAARPYMREALAGEAVLTIGGPLHEWHQGLIDGVISVGPLECMPNKIAEAQFYHIAEREGLLNLTLSLNGDSIDTQSLDNFAFEVLERFRKKRRQPRTAACPHG